MTATVRSSPREATAAPEGSRASAAGPSLSRKGPVAVGLAVTAVSILFTTLPLHNLAVIVSTVILTSALFSLAGLLNGLFAKSFDDEGARQGWCLYEGGCKGPVTYNACATLKWNGGVSFPIQSGHGCIGCSEDGFWDQGSFYNRVTDLTQFGIESNGNVKGCLSLPSHGAAGRRFTEGSLRQGSLRALWRRDGAFDLNRGFTVELGSVRAFLPIAAHSTAP